MCWIWQLRDQAAAARGPDPTISKAKNLLSADISKHHKHTTLATPITDRHMECSHLLTASFILLSSLARCRSPRGFRLPLLVVQTITLSWLGLPGPPVPNSSLGQRDTHRHIHVSCPWRPPDPRASPAAGHASLQLLVPPVVVFLEIHTHFPAPTLFTHSPTWSSLAATCSLTYPHLLWYCSTDK